MTGVGPLRLATALGEPGNDIASPNGQGDTAGVTLPDDWAYVFTGTYGRILYDDEPHTVTIAGYPDPDIELTGSTYRLLDYWGDTVASGSAASGAIDFGTLDPGWYRLLIERATPIATWGLSQGEGCLTVIRRDANFLDRPANGTEAGAAFDQYQVAFRSLFGMGPSRNYIDDAADPAGAGWGNLDGADTWATMHETYDTHPDAARPKHQFLAFRNGTWWPSTDVGIASVVNALEDRVSYWEGVNEPDSQSISGGDMAVNTADFRTKVLAADATAKILGPATTTINQQTAAFLEAFLAAGGGDEIDGFSFHEYNSINGDIALGRASYDTLVTLLTAHSAEDKERWVTEWGQVASNYGLFQPRMQAHWEMLAVLFREQYGITKERTSYFYDAAVSFWAYPSFWYTTSIGAFPLAAMMRTFSEEVYGKTFAERLDFGTVDNKALIGCRFSDGDDDLLSLISGGRTDATVTLDVTGASSLTVVSCFGVTSTVAVSAGQAVVLVGMEPVHVRVPDGVTATVAARSYGSNLAATATGDGWTTHPEYAVDGSLASPYYVGSQNPQPYNATDPTFPGWLVIRLGSSQTIDTVIVRCPPPWQQQGTLLDFDLQYWAGGAWVTLETVTEVPPTVQFMSGMWGAGCRAESYFSDRHVFQFEFAPVTTTKIRVYVRDATFGGAPDLLTAGVCANRGGKRVTITEVEVYNQP